MAGSMKLFQTVQKIHQTMGIDSFQLNRIRSINANSLFFILSIGLMFLSALFYFLFKANTIEDYMNSFNACISDFYMLISLLLTAWHMQSTIQLIEKCGTFMEKSTKL